jgi:uncharacterized protein
LSARMARRKPKWKKVDDRKVGDIMDRQAYIIRGHMKETLRYCWDERKNGINKIKHHVSFEDAVNAFSDKKRIIVSDDAHSEDEERFFCFGKIYDAKRKEWRIVTVRFTRRDEMIRIFGAGFWREGKARYEQENNEIKN